MDKLIVLYEDENYIGFLKYGNIPTTYKSIKKASDDEKCFLNIIKSKYSYLFNVAGHNKAEGGLLYRLDNDTSGLLLFAKNTEAFKRFIYDKSLQKIYLACVNYTHDNYYLKKIINSKTICINFPILHKSSKKMFVDTSKKSTSKKYKTYICLKKIVGNVVYLYCFISYGIRHQIRAHLSSINLPIIGDKLYNKKENNNNLRLYCIGIKSDYLNIFIYDIEKFL